MPTLSTRAAWLLGALLAAAISGGAPGAARAAGADGAAAARSPKSAAPAKPAPPAKPAKPAPPPPKPPVPNAALAQLKALEGSWTCAGRTLGPGPEHATSAAMTFAWHLDGFWLEVRYEESKTAANPVPWSSVSQWGFDELLQTLASSTVDSFSGIASQSSPGWQGDKLVFEGTAHRFATQFQARDTFSRHGDSQLLHTLEADVNGSWIKLHEDTCDRAPARKAGG
ncbi:MAG: DUF1579 family protein [Acidobacteria bacterium]|nr:DUF1579 family protein [Acidobacteriota bacterium]